MRRLEKRNIRLLVPTIQIEKGISFLTSEEIDEIEKLNEHTITDYITDMKAEKKKLVMKQYAKEREIRLWKTVGSESY